MKSIVIVGAGDLGKEIVWLIEDINKVKPTYVILGFLDDDKEKITREFFGYKVLGTTDQLSTIAAGKPISAVIAIQDSIVRKKIVETNPGFDHWENIIHPTAVIADSSTMGKGNIFFPQTCVSVDCKLGNFGLFYLHASIGNDCLFGDYVSVMLNTSVSEHVKVDNLSYIAADQHIPAHTRFRNEPLKKLVLIGAGGMGREVANMIDILNKAKPRYDFLGFVDDGARFKAGDTINGYPWLGTTEWIAEHEEDNIYYTCTIANVHIKERIQEDLMARGLKFETLVADNAYISPYSEVGCGCILYANVYISTNCKIGNGVLMNVRTNIGHDTIIGDYSTISPDIGISGMCSIGRKVTIGGHSYVIPGRKIGDGATVAAGSIVFTNVKAGTTVLGNPAKRMKGIEN